MAIYKGEEKKLKIELTAPGFDMARDNFEIQVISPKVTISGAKGNPDDTAKVRIVFEGSDSSDSSSSSSSSESGEGDWFAIVDTSTLTTGALKVVAIAYVRDASVGVLDGTRKEIAVQSWDTLSNP